MDSVRAYAVPVPPALAGSVLPDPHNGLEQAQHLVDTVTTRIPDTKKDMFPVLAGEHGPVPRSVHQATGSTQTYQYQLDQHGAPVRLPQRSGFVDFLYDLHFTAGLFRTDDLRAAALTGKSRYSIALRLRAVDRTHTDRWLDRYRRKLFRSTMERALEALFSWAASLGCGRSVLAHGHGRKPMPRSGEDNNVWADPQRPPKIAHSHHLVTPD